MIHVTAKSYTQTPPHAWWFPDLTGAADAFDDTIPHRRLSPREEVDDDANVDALVRRRRSLSDSLSTRL